MEINLSNLFLYSKYNNSKLRYEIYIDTLYNICLNNLSCDTRYNHHKFE